MLKLWCMSVGGILLTLGIIGNVPDVMDKWEAVGILGALTLTFAVIQCLIDYLEE